MSFLPILLFTLGVIVLLAAWRLGNPPTTSPELIAALKGIAGVKRDIGYIRSELQETGTRLEDHERRIEERKTLGLKAEEQPEQVDQLWQRGHALLKALQQEAVQEEVIPDLSKRVTSEQAFEPRIEDDLRSVPQVLSDKYRGVMQLHEQGWSTLEIAGHLAISQDAVNMVLRTYPRGGQR
ncbi:sigma-70 family RNA polymerase sigma factor [Desulfitobacterium sp.]|uniref:sigma-70 family RNA polymerase sigma factor n=1 Tax=Desulfitobacterium sp. TaxID=49981 RepID=UPI002C9584AC|nr:sigma-70 family RNA polymerase sigma factor [Desulfitobacterium sp.]HVJ48341.1 sigma-70 family RNA polymerase sigma factor [Desulfitobacterium sp.]